MSNGFKGASEMMGNLAILGKISEALQEASVCMAKNDYPAAIRAYGVVPACVQELYDRQLASEGKADAPRQVIEIFISPPGAMPKSQEIKKLELTIMYLVAQAGGEVLLQNSTIEQFNPEYWLTSYEDPDKQGFVYVLSEGPDATGGKDAGVQRKDG